MMYLFAQGLQEELADDKCSRMIVCIAKCEQTHKQTQPLTHTQGHQGQMQLKLSSYHTAGWAAAPKEMHTIIYLISQPIERTQSICSISRSSTQQLHERKSLCFSAYSSDSLK